METNKKVFAHYMVCNRDYGGSVEGFSREIAQAQAMNIDGFALNIGSWGDINTSIYAVNTANMFAAAALNATAQLTAANPKPPFVLFLSADKTGLDDASIIAIMTQYTAHPNYYKKSVPNSSGGTDLRPYLSTWGGEGGAYADVKARWHTNVLDPLRAAGINVFFVPRFFVHWAAADVTGLLVDFADGAWVQNSFDVVAKPGGVDPLADGSWQRWNVKQAGLYVMGTISPQYWGSRQTTNGRAYYEYQGGLGLALQYQAQINNPNVDDLEIFTWNDWDEATYINQIDDVNKYWPYCQNNTLNFYKQRTGYGNEIAFFNLWFKNGVQPPITQDELIAYHRTMPNSLHLADPLGTVYSGPPTAATNAPDALDAIFVTTKFMAAATLTYIGGSPPTPQTAQVAAGLQHTPFSFVPGAHSLSASRGGKMFLQLALEPIVSAITPPSYNFNYSSAVATAPYVQPLPTPAGGLVNMDFDLSIGQALTDISENLNTIASGTDGYVHAQFSCTQSDTKAVVDLSGSTPVAYLVPINTPFNPVVNSALLLPAAWLHRRDQTPSLFLALSVGPHGSVSPAPGQYKLYGQCIMNGEILGGYATGTIVFQ